LWCRIEFEFSNRFLVPHCFNLSTPILGLGFLSDFGCWFLSVLEIVPLRF
jgi:hypothetical protein